MRRLLRAVIVGGDPCEADVVRDSLEVGGFDVEFRRVEDAVALKDALGEAKWDVVFAKLDVVADGDIEVVGEVRSLDPEVPIIVLSAVGGIPGAVAAMRGGARDYVPLDDLERLVPAVARVLDDGKVRRDRQAAEAALQETAALFRSAFEDAPIGMTLVSLTEQNPVYIEVNSAFCDFLGYDEDELMGKTFRDITHPEDLPRDNVSLRKVLSGELDRVRYEKRYIHADGHTLWALLNVSVLRDAQGRAMQALTHAMDITEHKQAEERLSHLTMHDGLTGLPNRLQLMARLEYALEHARRTGGDVAVMLVGLDRFQSINDRFGHAAGDRYLLALGQKLRSNLPQPDTVARIGGDELVIVCGGVGLSQDIPSIVARLQRLVADPILIGDDEIVTTASVGIAVSRGGEDDPQDLIRAADVAMYRAKEGGRAGWEVFDERVDEDALRRIVLEDELVDALNADQFVLHYQPIVDLADGAVFGAEALLRFDHPTRGLLPPPAFLRVAEESGLIVPIGEWVLYEACHQQAAWQAAFGRPAQMCINLSSLQVAHSAFPRVVTEVLASTGVDPGWISLEITETTLMRGMGFADSSLGNLKERGMQVAIDDFGTGYSSLAYLKRFPIDAVKIDRAFVAGLGTDAGDTAIVEAVITLARALGLDVVAEGVETAEQQKLLLELGCRRAQGFYFAKPMPPEQFAVLLAEK